MSREGDEDAEVAAMTTAEYFAERKGRADMAAFDRILNGKGGEPPRDGDELPEKER